jgi:GT2 family glycosyltransferase/FMN phosphatase YigB (HAD superfamily)
MSTTSRRLTEAFRTGAAATTEPAVSLILAVYDPPIDALIAQLNAIAAQTSTDWECIVVDDASTHPEVDEVLREWVAVDAGRKLLTRPVNGGIAAATNDGLDAASGRFIAICDHDDVIHPRALEAVITHFEEHPEHDVVYTDEQTIDVDGNVIWLYAKPDWSPRRHLGHHYLAHLVAARRSTIGTLRVRQEFEPSQDYDFYLRVIEGAIAAGQSVGHISEVLYSWRAIAGSSALDAAEKPEMAAAVERCVQAALDRRAIDATAHTVVHHGRPTTSVRIADRGDSAPTVDVIRLTVDTTAEEINDVVDESGADVICLSPDPSRFDTDWAASLAVEALQPDVGVVGPLIVDEQRGTIVSAGRVTQPTLSDSFVGADADAPGPWGSFFVVREVSAIAPHGLTITTSAFRSVGGLATDVGLDAAVAEMCATLAASGRATVWTPAAQLAVTLPEGREQLAISRDEFDRVGSRTPLVHHEHFDVTVLGHLRMLTPDAYTRARRYLMEGRVDLVTSDVFDTLVTRHVATPSDLFVQLASALPLPEHVTALMFAEARREAERRARDQHSQARSATLRADGLALAEIEMDPEVAAPEITLHEIWSLMPANWADSDAGLTAELALEAKALQPIPEAVELYRAAHDLGVPVVLVSDIYLTGEQLASTLEAAGIDMSLIADVVSSADHRLGKAHGLLEQTISQRGVDPMRTMHLGDNEVADVETAESLGALAIAVDVLSEYRHVELPSQRLAAWSRESGGDLGISASVRATLVGSGPFGHDPSYQFGAAVAGPTLAGFSHWVSTTTAALGADHVHCMLREGATIAELMATTAPDGPTPIPLHVSRWVTMRAAVIDATPEQLVTALARRADLTVEHVTNAFACDPVLVRQVLGADVVESSKLVDACTAISENDKLRLQILDAASALRERVLVYLRDRLVIGDGPIVVADVGWGGTIQEGLTRILRADGIDNEVVGLYLALSSPGEQRLGRGARMLSYLPNETDDPAVAHHSRAIAHHADTIERIMTPELGTLIDIDAAGQPVCRPVGDDPVPPTLAAAQRAVRDVAQRLADPEVGGNSFTDPAWSDDLRLRAAFARTLDDVVTTPSTHLAEALGSWPHDDVAGTGHRSIAGQELAAAVRYANVRDVDLLDESGRSWIAGLAGAYNYPLSTQLAAAQAGIALDGLAPESENGMARLAAFEVGSDLAHVQVGRRVSVAPGGWSVLRISGAVESLRSLRFDAGEQHALVDIGYFSIALGTTQRFDPPVRHVALDDSDIVWVDAHPLDTQRFAHRPGGHILLTIDADLAPRVRSVDVTVAFRCWRLDDDRSLADAPLRHRVEGQTRRVAGAIKRRL